MERFSAAIRKALDEQNWFGALFLALALPEICGAVETPEADTRSRYKRWFKENLEHNYRGFLSPEDCYALRQASLHQGLSEIERRALSRIQFIEPRPGCNVHRSFLRHTLQLQIEVFCLDICEAVEAWIKAVRLNKELGSRMKSMIEIREPSMEATILL